MAGNSSNSSSNTGRMAVPEAKEAMKRFKEEVASELGVPLKDGYNGDLTSKQEAGRADEISPDRRTRKSPKKHMFLRAFVLFQIDRYTRYTMLSFRDFAAS